MKIKGNFRRGLFCLMFFIAFILPNLAFAEVEKEVGPNPEFFFKENPHSGIKLGLKNLEAFNELDSQVYIGLDGSFGDFYYFRDSEGNRLLPDNEINWELLKTKHFKGLWEVGVSQGLLPGISEYNLLYANVAYRGMYYTSIGVCRFNKIRTTHQFLLAIV